MAASVAETSSVSCLVDGKAAAAASEEALMAALRVRLEELIRADGDLREEQRIRASERASIASSIDASPKKGTCTGGYGGDEASPKKGASDALPVALEVPVADGGEEVVSISGFAADLVLEATESSGFELWLGSLEDALSLEALRERGINGVLNCALEECRQECACYRQRGRRSRSHARGASAYEAPKVDGLENLDRHQIQALVEFDADWYSDVLGYDTAYFGVEACDEADYAMDAHFEEVVEFLGRCRKEGRKVLVHCVMGVNRSAAALVAFLCRGLRMDLEEAVARVARRRGYILSNASFLDQLVRSFGAGDADVSGGAPK